MKNLYLLSLLTFLFSCSQVTVDYHMPTTGMYLPESSGKFASGYFRGGLQSDNKVIIGEASKLTLFSSSSSEPKVNTVPEEESSVGISLQAMLGTFEFLDIGLKTSIESTTMLVTNIQLIGSSAKERSAGHKLSIAMGVGSGEDTESSYNAKNQDTNKNETNLSGTIETKNQEAGLQYGYRFSGRTLLYTSYYFTKYEVEGEIKTTTKSYRLYNESSLQSINVGILQSASNERLSIQAEIGYAIAKVKGSIRNKHDMMNVLASLHLSF